MPNRHKAAAQFAFDGTRGLQPGVGLMDPQGNYQAAFHPDMSNGVYPSFLAHHQVRQPVLKYSPMRITAEHDSQFPAHNTLE